MQVLAQENLKKEYKTHPNMKAQLASKSAIRHFWSAEQHFQSVEWHLLRLWLDSLWMTIKYILFNFLAEGCVPVRILIVFAYFLSIPTSINRDWISKFNTLFYALRDTFLRSQISHIFDPPPSFLKFSLLR